LKIYLEVLGIYQDSLRLWNSKVSLTCASFYPVPCPIPDGYIHVDKDDPILKKYDFSIFENPKTGGYFVGASGFLMGSPNILCLRSSEA